MSRMIFLAAIVFLSAVIAQETVTPAVAVGLQTEPPTQLTVNTEATAATTVAGNLPMESTVQATVPTETTVATTSSTTLSVKPGFCPPPGLPPHKPPHHKHHKHHHHPHHHGPPHHKDKKSKKKPKFHSSSKESGSWESEENWDHHHKPQDRWRICETPACSVDRECPGNLKCCKIARCGMRCVKPVLFHGLRRGESDSSEEQ